MTPPLRSSLPVSTSCLTHSWTSIILEHKHVHAELTAVSCGRKRNDEGNKTKPTVICPPSLLCLWCLWVFFPLNTLDKPSGWKTYQSITLSVSLGRSLVLWWRSITISLFSLRSHAHRHHFSQWCCSTDEDQHKERLSHTAASSITLFFSSPCSLSLVLSLCVSMTLCLPLTFSQSSVVLHISLSRSLFLLPFFVLCYSF